MSSGEEKRQFPRLSIDVEVEYAPLHQEEAEVFTTATKNLSTGGICIIAFEELQRGSLLNLKFTFPPGAYNFIITSGRVAWVKELYSSTKNTTEKIYEVGIEFVNLSDAVKEKLEKYICKKI
jgi:c-di-GMP-binding flagellar brake protein YcgR